MTIIRSIGLFVLAAIAEIGGAWLVWQGVREHRGLLWIGAGVAALGLYGFAATLQPDPTSAGSWPPTAASSSPAPWPGASS
jgi:small multidrug resistance family-3 protein